MTKLLTIAIPTYNRAQLLDKQLTWLAQAIKGFESECEIIISDNRSSDNTQEIIHKWQLHFINDVPFQNNRNHANIGVMRNIAHCINTATSKYLWMIGDDDPIQNRTLAYVINELKQHQELSLLTLNFACRYQPTGKIIYERCFAVDKEEVNIDGKAVFQHCLEENHSGIGFLSAQVYRTKIIQNAVAHWPKSVNNMEAQVYWVGYCAAHGSVKVTKEVYLESAFGSSYWMKDPKVLLKMQYIDLPTIYAKIEEIGYSSKYCRNLILKHFTHNNWKVFFGALRRWPIIAINTIIPYLILVVTSVWEIFLSPKRIESRSH
ncbi:glycosyltransferase family 2 protein [Calothrix rhizosoleniae]|uniref:glycosyltransferase family 2 protein n=1 Tax=Calothrix rhizosoleniae TaxID=888997 RepID=UPI000B49B0D3|nr:glycosyltransferase [Calothrix rhizosoleniae]